MMDLEYYQFWFILIGIAYFAVHMWQYTLHMIHYKTKLLIRGSVGMTVMFWLLFILEFLLYAWDGSTL